MASDQSLTGESLEGTSEPPEPIDIRMDKRIDLALSLAVAAAGLYICWTAWHFRIGSFPDPLGTRGLPYITGGFMVLAGLFNAGRRLLTWSHLPGNLTVSEGKEDDPSRPSSSTRPFAIVALAFAWCLLVTPLGYLIVTPVMIFAMAWLMGVRSRAKLIGFPLGYTVLVWAVFSQVFNVILPLGPLTALARSWGLTP